MKKYVVGKEQKHLVVSKRTHVIIKQYAHENGLTMIEATYKIIRIGILKLMGMEVPPDEYS